MSIDHGKLLALCDVPGMPDQWDATDGYMHGWNDCLRALAQPAEAVNPDLCPACKTWPVDDDSCPNCGREKPFTPAEAAQSATINSPETFTTSIDAAQEAVAWQINATKSHRGWESCTRESYEDTLRTGRYMGLSTGTRDVEVRPLYTRPQAAPAQVDGMVFVGWSSKKQIDRLRTDLDLTGIMVHDEETITRNVRMYAQLAAAPSQEGES